MISPVIFTTLILPVVLMELADVDGSPVEETPINPTPDDSTATEIIGSPLSQSTYLAIWAISLVASFGIFFVYF